jgi:hypothetical protein
MLKAYGVSLDDRHVHDNLLWDLYVLNKNHGNSNTLYCKIRSIDVFFRPCSFLQRLCPNEEECAKTKPKRINALDASGILLRGREAIKSREEVQVKDEKVQEKILEIKGKLKRGLYEGAEARQVARRQRQLDARQEVLDSPSPEGRMRTLRELRMLQLNKKYS